MITSISCTFKSIIPCDYSEAAILWIEIFVSSWSFVSLLFVSFVSIKSFCIAYVAKNTIYIIYILVKDGFHTLSMVIRSLESGKHLCSTDGASRGASGKLGTSCNIRCFYLIENRTVHISCTRGTQYLLEVTGLGPAFLFEQPVSLVTDLVEVTGHIGSRTGLFTGTAHVPDPWSPIWFSHSIVFSGIAAWNFWEVTT